MPKAQEKGGEIPKPEGRKPKEIRMSNSELGNPQSANKCGADDRRCFGFGFRLSFALRDSAFGFGQLVIGQPFVLNLRLLLAVTCIKS